eukprot:gene4620-5063_t
MEEVTNNENNLPEEAFPIKGSELEDADNLADQQQQQQLHQQSSFQQEQQAEEVREGTLFSTPSPKKKSLCKAKRSSSKKSSCPLTSQSAVLLPSDHQEGDELTAAAASQSPRLTTKSLTLPSSPQFNIDKRMKSSSRASMHQLSSEDLLLAKLEEERNNEKKKIAKAQQMYSRLKAKGFQSKAASSSHQTVKKLTIPKAPKSALTGRLGAKVPSVLKRSPQKKEEKVATTSPRPHLTIPVPFQFATDSRMKSTAAIDRSSSLTAGELAQKFFQDPRSHYVPEHAAKKLTEAHSPVLKTKQRCMSASKERPLSYEERIEQEMQEIMRHSFKAREIDRRIFESNGELGVPKVEAKPLTVPQEFHLQLEIRAAELKDKKPATEEEPSAQSFKALPLPDFIREPSRQAPTPRLNFQPTIPVSPKLHGGERASSAPARRQRPHHKEVEQKKQEEAEAWRKCTKDFQKLTTPEEFHLHTSERGANYQQMMQEYLRQEEEMERERAKVKALPLPDLSKTFQPKPSDRSSTAPQPFELMSVALHEEAEARHQMQKEKEGSQESASFKARPLPKSTYEPKVVEAARDENRAPVVPQNVQLASDLRAEKRHQFDEQLVQKQSEQKKLVEQVTREREAAEKKALKDLRRKSVEEGGLVFKAREILRTDPFAPKQVAAPKPATIPRSPKLRLKDRSRSRSLAGGSAELPKEATKKGALLGGARRMTVGMPR